ncbi:MAG TPA: 4'-phosphopantetheinyl transferase superfamily protein [Rhodoblastus sp.]|nr:4'-phosphopantetheinyl transferase superfamily protein [Rhodoblastus sp.]
MAARRRRTPIEPLALSFDYPHGRADILVARLDEPVRDLSPARAALARRLVARRVNCAEADVVIAHDAQGAPLVAPPRGGLRLSTAGRDAIVAAAVAGHAVGVDIETIAAPFAAPLNVLHPAERAALAAAGERAHEFFLRIWTAKEAYVKALGTGLAREPSEIEIRQDYAAAFDGPAEIGVFDCGRAVATLRARAGRVSYGQDAVMLACVVLPF